MKDFEQNLKGDPRLAALRVAQRNFERHAPSEFVEAVRTAELFSLYEHFLILNPHNAINVIDKDADSLSRLPRLFWRPSWWIKEDAGDVDSYYSLDIHIGTNEQDVIVSLYYHSRVSWRDTYTSIESGKEATCIEEFQKPDVVKTIISDFLKIGQFKTTEIKQLDFRGLDPDGYFEVLRLHPLAFTDLTNEEAEELLNRAYRFASRKHHSDIGGDDEVMKRVNAARDFFKDPVNRKPQG